MTQNEFWDSQSKTVNFTTPLNISEFAKYVSRDDSILDFGCGYGRTVNDLFQLGYRDIIGIDASEQMIKRGKVSYPYLDLRYCGDGNKVADCSVDAVILFGVMSSTPFEEDQKNIIAEVKRVLKPNGILYINEFLLNRDLNSTMKYKKYEKEYNKYGIFKTDNGGIMRHYTKEEILDIFSDFDVLDFTATKFKTLSGSKSNGVYAFFKHSK